jgi:diadenosine tetraphosphatase ApaH/serine/threonine PP2A family protein phosphatase
MGASLGTRAGDIVCFGHTHIPWHRVVDDVYFVNTGSVGRPKDGDRRATYTVIDIDSGNVAVELVRAEYDVEAAARGVLESDLPHELADQLRSGGVLSQPARP